MAAAFSCETCGTQFPKWSGRCEGCGSWNSLKEVDIPVMRGRKRPLSKGSSSRLASGKQSVGRPKPFSEIAAAPAARMRTGLPDVDRVLGGGLVPGMVVLLSGEPGIGKSTLLLQVCAALAQSGRNVLYASGEESGGQVRLRADRLGIAGTQDRLAFVHEQDADAIIGHLGQEKADILIVDSIQTAYVPEIAGEPGNVAQVRAAAGRIAEVAKRSGTAVILVGHVTKEGTMAGPKTLEHLVDAVLQLEGDRMHAFRVLRSLKNRFGATDETAIFSMEEEGLVPVANPSAFFLAERQEGAPGSVVTATVEGSSVFLVETQAIASPSPFGYPKRTSSGFDLNRLQLLVAVLAKVVGLPLAERDVYANVVGGVRLAEPAGDLAVALAVASSVLDRPANGRAVAFGEVGLTGEVRSVPHLERRLKEAQHLGFTKAVVPRGTGRPLKASRLEIVQVRTLREAMEALLTLVPARVAARIGQKP